MRASETPECRWVTVPDGSGRPRLEMRWTTPGAPVATRDERAA